MNKSNRKPQLKGRDFNGKLYPKIRRVREEPRHKIRQLLRSFIPLNQPESKAQNTEKTQP